MLAQDAEVALPLWTAAHSAKSGTASGRIGDLRRALAGNSRGAPVRRRVTSRIRISQEFIEMGTQLLLAGRTR